jgi:hypothetical protein
MGQRWLDGYSAEVEIYLEVAGKRYDVAQIGGGSLLLRDSHTIPPATEAKLVMRIDGVEEVEQIFLGSGAVNNEVAVSYF